MLVSVLAEDPKGTKRAAFAIDGFAISGQEVNLGNTGFMYGIKNKKE